MLAGYDPEEPPAVIRCPVLLLQADPEAGGLLRDEEVRMGMRLLSTVRTLCFKALATKWTGPADAGAACPLLDRSLPGERVEPPF